MKIADFGISKRARASGEGPDTRSFTAGYEAPEQRGAVRGNCSHATDIFATGVITFLLLSGRLPFGAYGDEIYQFCRNINEESKHLVHTLNDAQISAEGTDFIKRLLKPYPAERPDAGSCLTDDWIQGVTTISADNQSKKAKEPAQESQSSWWPMWPFASQAGPEAAASCAEQKTSHTKQEKSDDYPQTSEDSLPTPTAINDWTGNRAHSVLGRSTTSVEEGTPANVITDPAAQHAPRFPERSSVATAFSSVSTPHSDHAGSASLSGWSDREVVGRPNVVDVPAQPCSVHVDPAFQSTRSHSSGYHGRHSRSRMDDYSTRQMTAPTLAQELYTPFHVGNNIPNDQPRTSFNHSNNPSDMNDSNHFIYSTPTTREQPRHALMPSPVLRAPRHVQSMGNVSPERSRVAWTDSTVAGGCDVFVTVLTVSENGKYGASWGGDQMLRVWIPQSGRFHGQSEITDVISLRFSPGASILAVRTKRAIKLFDMENWPNSRKTRASIGGEHHVDHTFAKECLFSRDGQRLAAISDGSGRGRRIWLYNIGSTTPFRQLDTGGGSVSSIAISPDLTTMVASLDDNTVRTYSLPDYVNRNLWRHSAPPSSHVTRVVFNADGSAMAASSTSGVLKLWYSNRQTGESYARDSPSQNCRLFDCAFCPGKDLVVTADDRGTILFFRASTAEPYENLFVQHAEPGAALRVLISPDGRFGVSCGYRTLEVWCTATARVLLRTEPRSTDGKGVEACFCGTLNILAFAIEGGVRLIDLRSFGDNSSTPHA